MDINNPAAILRLRERWQVRTLKAFTEGPPPVAEMIGQIEQSTAAVEVYDMLVKFPAFEKFKDQIKKSNMAREQVRIGNDEFADVVSVSQANIERDQIGQYNNMFDMLGMAARRHPDKLMAALMASGFTTNDYTGLPFFAANKPHLPGVVNTATFTNLMTNKPSAASWEAAKQLMGNILDANGDPMGLGLKKTVVCSTKWLSTFKQILHAELIGQVVGSGAAAVSNIYAGDAEIIEFTYLNTPANQDKWFVLDTGWPLRAFILQKEVALRQYAQDNPNIHKDAFDHHVFNYQGYYRGNVGFGMPQLAIGSTGADAAL
jgi:phage major head subunit gpT-like protein